MKSFVSAALLFLAGMFGTHGAAPLPIQPAAVASAFSTHALPLSAVPITHPDSTFPTPQPFVATAASGPSISNTTTLSQNVKQPAFNTIKQPEIINGTATNFVTRDDLIAALTQATNALRSLIYQTESVPGSFPSSGGTLNNIAVSNAIDQLTGTKLNNVTVNGVSGLTAADIPTLAGTYLPLTGGTLSGDLTVGGNFTAGSISFAAASSSLLSVYGPAYFGATATSSFASTGALTLATPLAVTSGGTGTTTWQIGSIPFFNGANFAENNGNLFWDNSNKRLGIGLTNPSGKLQIAGNVSQPSWTFTGVALGINGATYTDNSSLAGSTVSERVANVIGTPTFAFLNGTSTITTAATLYISGGPKADTSSTGITNSVALHLGGDLFSQGSVGIGTFANATTSLAVFKNYTAPLTGQAPLVNISYTAKGSGTVTDQHQGINVSASDEASVQNATITSATNASPIVITTASANTFSTGDKIDVYGVVGNTAANGTWIITVIDSANFSLTNSTGNGSYSSGGIATNRGLLYAYFCGLSPKVGRGGLSGSGGLGDNSHGDDANCYTVYNGSSNSSVAGDAIYIGHNSVFGTNNEWATDFSSAANAWKGIVIGGTIQNAAIDLTGASLTSNEALTIPNGGEIQGLNTNGSTLTNLLSLDSLNDVNVGSSYLQIPSVGGNAGHVGIGTSTPTAPLTIVGPSSNTAGTGIVQLGNSASPAQAWSFRLDNSSQDLALDRESGGVWSEAARFQRSSGNFGLGTTTPGSLLTVSGNETIAGNERSLNFQDFGNSNRLAQLGIIDGFNFELNAPSSNFQVIANAVGIGSTTPSAKLSVTGKGITTGYTFIAANSSNLPLFNVQDNGLVGIGTTSPWRTLAVTGTVGFDGLGAITGTNSSLCLDSNKQVVVSANSDSCASSLRSTKHDIAALNLMGTTTLAQLVPVSFVYNNDASSTVRYGFIAEDAAAVDPHFGTYDQNGNLSGIDDRSFIAVIVKATQELVTEVDNLSNTVAGFADNFVSAHITAVTADIQTANIETANVTNLCVTDVNGKTCVTRSQLDALLNAQGVSASAPLPQTPSPSLAPDATTTSPDDSAATTTDEASTASTDASAATSTEATTTAQ